MPSDAVLKTMNAVHRTIQRVTGGRKGWQAFGMEVVELTTTGRRSGLPRTVLLTAPSHLEGSPVLVASRGGDDTHPAWFLNLCADPNVTVRRAGGPVEPARARVLTAEERADLWPTITAAFDNYARYQTRTDREIPLVVITPSAADRVD